MFQRALAIEPGHAAAHAGLADFCAHLVDPDDFQVNDNIACAFASLGEKDDAVTHLERIIGPHTLPSQKQYLLHDSGLDVLHDHPGFQALQTILRA